MNLEPGQLIWWKELHMYHSANFVRWAAGEQFAVVRRDLDFPWTYAHIHKNHILTEEPHED